MMACHKYPATPKNLPPVTEEGKNTVGFLLDGEIWLPYHRCSIAGDPCEEISARYSFPLAARNSIDFGFSRMRNNKLSYLLISGPFATITGPGNKIDSVGVIYSAENRYANNGAFSKILPGSNFIITKLDTTAKIISGTFQFLLEADDGSGETVNIKEGRFDFQFNACICSN